MGRLISSLHLLQEGLDRFFVGQYQEMVCGLDDSMGRGHNGLLAICGIDANDVGIIFFPDPGIQDASADPFLDGRDLIDGIFRPQVQIIEDIFAAVFDGGPDGGVLVGVDDLIGAVFQQELGQHLIVRLADDVLRPQLPQQVHDHQIALEVRVDADEAHIEVGNADLAQHIPGGAVRDQAGAGNVLQIIDGRFIFVHDHHFVVHLYKLAAQMVSKITQSDN